MDLTRLAVDAGQFINRAVQYTEESLGHGEKTELDPGLDELFARADATKARSDQMISQTEVLLQPNSGTALLRCGEAQRQLGEAERKFVQSTTIHFLTPLRSFTEGEYGAMQDERKMLVNKRLDLDIAKTRVRKAHEADREGRSLNTNPLEDDYLSHVSYMFSFLRVKWLKMWAQEIAQTNHMRSLMDFVEGQACYFHQCHQHTQELQRQLASIPAVLCSNNWRSAISADVNQPSGAAPPPPIPIVVHQIPDFDQDSWTSSPLGATEKKPDTSVTTKSSNNNNNNNTCFSDEQATSHCSVVNQRLHAWTPNSGQISASAQANGETAAITNPTTTTTSTTTTSPPPELTGYESQTANAAACCTTTTDNLTIETLKQPTSGPALNEEDVPESSSAAGQDGVQ
ncbi:Endophilin-B1 [Liparis tanakae]|uniref:Endophilin-B1 n=1 Tax=Liparis tanakae TaxID=230148 RepID=A0A4Z2IKA6_9TELE|nr:Endophilin-B1 [Liparis tanakae]